MSKNTKKIILFTSRWCYPFRKSTWMYPLSENHKVCGCTSGHIFYVRTQSFAKIYIVVAGVKRQFYGAPK
jgi:hypothetical protein